MRELPAIMVAPNGARPGKADHPALPVTIPEILDCAIDCAAAGAGGIHAHVRDGTGAHVLDRGLYAELLAELGARLPGFYAQITTESVGRYSPAQQRALALSLGPVAVSVALREITAGEDAAVTRRFFHDCAAAGVDVQHILYDEGDIAHLADLVAAGDLPAGAPKVLIVLGRHDAGAAALPAALGVMAQALRSRLPQADWAACAFGRGETDMLVAARAQGGKARVGFENNMLHADGSLAATNAARVAALVAALSGQPPIGG